MARLLIAVFLTGFLGGIALCYRQIDSVTRQFGSLGRTARNRYPGQRDEERPF